MLVRILVKDKNILTVDVRREVWKTGDGRRQAAVNMSVQNVDICNADAETAGERELAFSYLNLWNEVFLENVVYCLNIPWYIRCFFLSVNFY